jgi:hypothetical protein
VKKGPPRRGGPFLFTSVRWSLASGLRQRLLNCWDPPACASAIPRSSSAPQARVSRPVSGSRGFDSSGYAGRLNQRRVEFREQVPGVPDAPSSQPSPTRGEGSRGPTACCTTFVSGCNPLRTQQEKTLSLRSREGSGEREQFRSEARPVNDYRGRSSGRASAFCAEPPSARYPAPAL